MNLHDEPKIDAHCHVFDPQRFAYAPDAKFRPAGAERGTPAQLHRLLDAHGVRHALLVGPNSGYGEDNRCLLDTIASSRGRFRGVAVVANSISLGELRSLRSAGIVGVAMNATYHGVEHYLDSAPLLARLASLDLFAQVQVEANQLPILAPLLERSGVRVVIDHCGRPQPSAGLHQPGFAALLGLAKTGRVAVKLSGFHKFGSSAYPDASVLAYVRALIDAFGLDACVWGSDWPFLRVAERIDYGPLLQSIAELLPDPAERRRLWWDTPRRLFGFDNPSVCS